MKKLLLLVIMLFSLSFVNAQDAGKLTGKWKGSYNCRQGDTGLTMKIKGNSNGEFTGTFKFYPIPSNKDPLVKSGKFSFTGKYTSSGKIIFTQNKWIKQPLNYLMIDLEGELTDDNTINGHSTTDGCGSFKVIKQ